MNPDEILPAQSTSDRMHAYREGFYEGAKAVLKAIGDDLPEVQMRVLRSWVDGPLSAWRQGAPDTAAPPLPLIDGA